MTATSYLRNGNGPQVTVSEAVTGNLRAGYGLQKLHVGMTREQCRGLFGDPDHVRSFQDGTFFQYLDLGFDIDFELGSKAERLFFYRAGVQKHKGQCDVRVGRLSFGSTSEEIANVLGPPSRSGSVGKKQWLMYEKGIQFDIDSRGRVEVIIVFRV